VQIDCLLLQGSPEPLDEDVVQIASPPIHRDFDIGLRQRLDPIRARVLATLDALLSVKRRFALD
jgi:hypothetical protein